tara:strand:- start:171 stop:551 length:381 start_codon:yes stop_codon:yes gene_type:complete
MAPGRRVVRVAALIKREVSELLLYGLKDERIQLGMVSITEVDVSGDLQHCKIFVSIFGDNEIKEKVMLGLASSCGFLKGELGRRLELRRAPEISFELDKIIDKGNSVLELLGSLEENRKLDDQVSI